MTATCALVIDSVKFHPHVPGCPGDLPRFHWVGDVLQGQRAEAAEREPPMDPPRGLGAHEDLASRGAIAEACREVRHWTGGREGPSLARRHRGAGSRPGRNRQS